MEEIAKRCWRTSATRFESSRRMKRCYNSSTVCVSILSIEIIVINLLVLVQNLYLDSTAVTVTTVCLSVFVLVLSLLISQLQYEKKEECYLKCAMELANLEKEIKIYVESGLPDSYEVKLKYNEKYNLILQKFQINHSTIDYDWAMIKMEKKEGGKPKNCYELRKWIWTYIRWHFLLTDSVYNLITVLGACAIVLVPIFCKDNDEACRDSGEDIKTEIINRNHEPEYKTFSECFSPFHPRLTQMRVKQN